MLAAGGASRCDDNSCSCLIERVAVCVKEALERDSGGHDWQHVRRVWHNAKLIGSEERADMLAVELAALLHDIDDWKTVEAKSHPPAYTEPLKQEKAVAFLAQAGAGENLIEQVCRIIAAIDYRGSLSHAKVATVEDRVVYDADKLDAIGAIGVARCFAFNGKIGQALFRPDLVPCPEIDAERYRDIHRPDNTAINHFFDKLLRLKDRMYTRTGRKMAEERHLTMIAFLQAFFREQALAEWEALLQPFLPASVAQ